MTGLPLVDDDASLHRVTEKQLGDAGHEVVAVAPADLALEAFAAAPPDLVLTDIQTPGMDGLALLAELKRRDPAVAVVLITACGRWTGRSRPCGPGRSTSSRRT